MYVYVSSCCFHQGTYVAQSHMNGAPNETQTHMCRFVSQIAHYMVKLEIKRNLYIYIYIYPQILPDNHSHETQNLFYL